MTETAGSGSPTVEVRRSARRRRTVSAYRRGDTIVVLVPGRLTRAQERVAVADLVQKVLAREARTRPPRTDEGLAARAAALAHRWLRPAAGIPPRPSAIRWVGNQDRRWGSCTPATGVIRLSDRLQGLPDWVVDYVIVHELTHLIEVDHSARFWALVAHYPQAERARGYLLGYAARGLSFGPRDPGHRDLDQWDFGPLEDGEPEDVDVDD